MPTPTAYLTLSSFCQVELSAKLLIEMTNTDTSGTSLVTAKLEQACKKAIGIFEHETRTTFDETNYNDLSEGSEMVLLLLKMAADFTKDNSAKVDSKKKEWKDQRKQVTAHIQFDKFRDETKGDFNNQAMEGFKAGSTTGEDTEHNININW